MNSLLIGLLGVLVATNQPAAVSNLVHQQTGINLTLPDPNDPVEKEFQGILADDDAAQADAIKWIAEEDAYAAQGLGGPRPTLALRIDQRYQPVRKAYEYFLQRYPRHVRARIAYGSFLNDTGKEIEASVQWQKAVELDPKNPAAWNNLGNFYGHCGPISNAFACYEKAIQINSNEPVYYQNLGTMVYLYRQDAMEIYHLTEPQVFDRALELYRKALKLDPDNFVTANDLAQSYYGIKPSRIAEALASWQYALKTAKDELQREGVYLHLARWQIQAQRYDEAHKYLASVTNETYQVVKDRLLRNLSEKEKPAQSESLPATPDGLPPK
jgi:tetratricopeptide (TPR) repeat protein